MATVKVKSTRKDGRVAFYERGNDHPNGQVFVRGDQKEVEVGDTRALRKAIRDGKVVEVAQAAPVSRTQTPPTKTAPFEGYDELNAEQVVAKLPELDDAGRASVLAYEKAKGERARKTIIEKLAGAPS